MASETSTAEATTLPEPEPALPWLSPHIHPAHSVRPTSTVLFYRYLDLFLVHPCSSPPPHPLSDKTQQCLASPPVPSSPRIAQASSADATSARPLETRFPTLRSPCTARKGHTSPSLHVLDHFLITIAYLLYLAWLDSFTLRSPCFGFPFCVRPTDLHSSHSSFILAVIS